MAVTNSATLTLEYADGTTRNLTFADVPTSALSGIKGRAVALNAVIADTVTGAAYTDTFISDNGEPITKIKGAKYTITNEQVIYNG